ncbi:MAG: ABC transporter permease [Gammaproteobacteria bacterium]|nr:ABC transporter permease [Gammaproteobacteria bacterium]MCW5582904.1 ABC transporter permease [Gammaproteobacteria bacterium]
MSVMLRGIFICIVFSILWQSIVFLWHVPSYLLPSPWQVLLVLYQQCHLIALHTIPTLIETLLGFLLGIFFGCVTGLVITFFRPLRFWFWPVLIMSQAIPTFAIAPMLVIWLGYGLASKIATTVLMIFFPITSALYDGLRQTHAGWLDLAKSMNACQWRTFMHIRLPAALPSLAAGIRIAAVAAPIGAIVGEWVGSSRGLGYLMLNANARMQIDVMFAALVVIISLALVLYFCVDNLLHSLVMCRDSR